jgi:hypothetical protein
MFKTGLGAGPQEYKQDTVKSLMDSFESEAGLLLLAQFFEFNVTTLGK